MWVGEIGVEPPGLNRETSSLGDNVAQWRYERPLDGVVRIAEPRQHAQVARAAIYQVDSRGRLLKEARGAA